MSRDIETLRQRIRGCTACGLRAGCNQAVPPMGSGRVLIIGEAPGRNEDEMGVPFVGAAGRVLWNTLALVGFDPPDVTITNTVCCRPPDNRTPKDEERQACWPNLRDVIESVDPRVIILLGSVALTTFWPQAMVGDERGRPFWNEVAGKGRAMIATWHPAYVLRTYGTQHQFLADLALAKVLSLDLSYWPDRCESCGVGGDPTEYDSRGRTLCSKCAPKPRLFVVEDVPRPGKKKPVGSR